jgi:hypothetical protein
VARVPNQYYLHGGGISVTYSPEGSGPVRKGGGPLILAYQDDHQSLPFNESDVRTVDVADLGTIVSVTLATTADTDMITFSLLIPDVQLPEPESSVSINTSGVTTVHRALVALTGQPQRETYTITALSGTAALGSLPRYTAA